MYAIIHSGGKQHRAEQGGTLTIERLTQPEGETVQFDQVLMVHDGDEIRVGRPHLEGAQVVGTVVSHQKAPKILVFKKKRRKQYRRTNGHRQLQTVVRIDKIQLG